MRKIFSNFVCFSESPNVTISPLIFENLTTALSIDLVQLIWIFILPSSVLKYEAHRFHDGYLQITIKDKGFLGQGIFLGEAFFPLNELRLGDMDQKLHDLQQIQLPLSKPSGFGK